ncbi:MAG: Plug domain-containing protein [Bacteroidota bacterium]
MAKPSLVLRAASTVLLLVLIAPTTDAARGDVTQNVPVAVEVIGRESIEQAGRANVEDLLVEVLLAQSGSVNTISMGRTDAEGATLMLRGTNGRPSLNRLLMAEYTAAYVRSIDGTDAALLIGNPLNLDQIEVLRGPQGTLFGRNAAAGAIRLQSPPRLDGCAGIKFEVNLNDETLTARQAWCDEPVLMAVECPSTVSVGEEVRVGALVSESVNARVNWSLDSGTQLTAQYRDLEESEFNFDTADVRTRWAALYGAGHTFALPGVYNVNVTSTNDYGTDAFSCPVLVEEESDDSETDPEVRVTVGYNVEFGKSPIRVGGTMRVPVELPVHGDASLGYFSVGDRGYTSLTLELAYRSDFTDRLSFVAGGGIHFLRAGSDNEIGPGVSGRVYYDGDWAVEPLVELNAAYQYNKLIPTLSFGGAYRFDR